LREQVCFINDLLAKLVSGEDLVGAIRNSMLHSLPRALDEPRVFGPHILRH